jgi:hypothetical protein
MKKFESQVCSYEFSKELNQYNYDFEPWFYWLTKTSKSKPRLINYKSKFAKEKDKVVPAFTVAELGEVLLQIVDSYKVYIFPKDLKFYHGRDEYGTCEASSEADLRAYMLIRAIECSKVKYR